MSEYNIKIITAINGHIVINNNNKDQIYLVHDGDDLGGIINAAIVGGKLTGIGQESDEMSVAEIDDLLVTTAKKDKEIASLQESVYRHQMDSFKYGGVSNPNSMLGSIGVAATMTNSYQNGAQQANAAGAQLANSQLANSQLTNALGFLTGGIK